ncbi:hypothetical protein BDM02DRAFT_687083 [Thelephora ganbajun]|uniref:Uncharacterized protein n=1 Tax=Thelephora ganbajun TaxID=370292 RepID=A0ACB6Z6Q0_THEGA|nr:hypothetical protein BDM02DRAFT_687083 [Thelephora ganbajun]
MSILIPSWTDSFLDKQSDSPRRRLKSSLLANALYFHELTGGTGAFVRLCRLFSLEASLQPLGVLRSERSVVDGHLGTAGRYAYLVSGLLRVGPAEVAKACGRWRSAYRVRVLISVPLVVDHLITITDYRRRSSTILAKGNSPPYLAEQAETLVPTTANFSVPRTQITPGSLPSPSHWPLSEYTPKRARILWKGSESSPSSPAFTKFEDVQQWTLNHCRNSRRNGIILLDLHPTVVGVASTTDPTGTSTDVKFTVRRTFPLPQNPFATFALKNVIHSPQLGYLLVR